MQKDWKRVPALKTIALEIITNMIKTPLLTTALKLMIRTIITTLKHRSEYFSALNNTTTLNYTVSNLLNCRTF